MNDLQQLLYIFSLNNILNRYKQEIHVILVLLLAFRAITAQTIPTENTTGSYPEVIVMIYKCEKNYSLDVFGKTLTMTKNITFYNFTWNVLTDASNDHDFLNIVRQEVTECRNETNITQGNNYIFLPEIIRCSDFDCNIGSKWSDLTNVSLSELNTNNPCNVPGFIYKLCDCDPNTFELVKFELGPTGQSRLRYRDDPSRNFRIVEFTCTDNNTREIQRPPEIHSKQDTAILMPELTNLTLGNLYEINIRYYDEDKEYCSYNNHVFLNLEAQEMESAYVNYASIVLIILIAIIIIYIVIKISKVHHRIIYKLKQWILPSDLSGSNVYSITIPKRPSRPTREELNPLYDSMETIQEISPNITEPYEFPRENIELKVVIGEGNFGKVYYAKAHGLFKLQGYAVVAVKVLKAKPPVEEIQDFSSEIEMLKRVTKHKNVVRMFACVTKSQPYMMIMELVLSGDLKEYLLELREIWSKQIFGNKFFKDTSDCTYIESSEKYNEVKKVRGSSYIIRKHNKTPINGKVPTPAVSQVSEEDEVPVFKQEDKSPLPEELISQAEPILDNKELENFALQIANGMAHLEKLGITHRDLAARNILVTRSKILKISDFGMSRLGTYVNKSEKKLPLRWMALETLEQFKANSKSDVWSFGVVLWEIGTLGAFPYGRLDNDLILPYLKNGQRLLRPEICTDDLFELMLNCWTTDPNKRPSFEDLVKVLSKKSCAYVEFSQIKSTYIFPNPVLPEND